jgi:3-oxoacyl-[acyl-carrier-protein] synthase II
MRRALASASWTRGDRLHQRARHLDAVASPVAAVKALFASTREGQHLLTKSMHGHHLGASGAVETIACVNALRKGVLPPTINLDHPDEGFDLDFVPHTARERPVRVAMNNTFGFGGHNVTLIFARA